MSGPRIGGSQRRLADIATDTRLWVEPDRRSVVSLVAVVLTIAPRKWHQRHPPIPISAGR